MEAWHSTHPNHYQVAHIDEDGDLRLDFGKHRGATLAMVPDRYLRWMVAGSGKGFLPMAVRDAATCELDRRATARQLPSRDEVEVTDLRNAGEIIEWAQEAPTGDLAELRGYLLRLVADLERVLDRREKETVIDLLQRLDGDSGTA
jgi:hypothetical protein